MDYENQSQTLWRKSIPNLVFGCRPLLHRRSTLCSSQKKYLFLYKFSLPSPIHSPYHRSCRLPLHERHPRCDASCSTKILLEKRISLNPVFFSLQSHTGPSKSMDIGGTCSRHLSFEDVDDDTHNNQHGTDIGHELNINEVVNFMSIDEVNDVPKNGMSFHTEVDAYEFYLKYSRRMGFGIRRSRNHKNKSGELIDRIFCCSAQGKRLNDKRDVYVRKARPETRFSCEAMMKIRRHDTGKFFVVKFNESHSHPLSSPNKIHLHRSHRKIEHSAALQIQMANDVGITPKASHDLMARQAGGRENLGFIPRDYKNYLRSKRTRATRIGDTGGLLEYLQKMQFDDPNFFYAIQVDEDDLITNIFWSDARMRTDYSHFGDVVCFDTTYKKNNEGRPIALFVGVNHHKQSVIFGAALLYDETSLTFEWLFHTFARAVHEKKPITILTDQDAAMAKALASTWPEMNHRLCLWHIFQNAAIHLSYTFSKFKEFAKDFGACVYDFEEETEFLAAWDSMLNKYGLEDNDWLKRMFKIRDKWSLVYGRQMFCGDMTTTQRSESMNGVVKKYVSYKHKFLDFFNHFERLLEDRRYEELIADFKAKTSRPSLVYPVEILSHALSIYTPAVYRIFENEWYKSHDSNLECFDDGVSYKITPHRKKYHHLVTFEFSSGKASCSCRKFEFAGILCSHILKVFTTNNVKKIPDEYILKRWSRQAKVGFSGESSVSTCSLDPKVLRNKRYRELCNLNIQLATKASENEEDYRMVRDNMLKSLEMVDGRLRAKTSIEKQGEMIQVQDVDRTSLSLNGDELQVNEANIHGAKGIKYKKKTTSGKRFKSALEKATSKTRAGRKKKDQPSAPVSTSPKLSSSNLEVMQNEEDIINTTSMVPVALYQGLNAKEAGKNSSQQLFDGFPSSMSMTSLLLAQQPFNFDSFGSRL